MAMTPLFENDPDYNLAADYRRSGIADRLQALIDTHGLERVRRFVALDFETAARLGRLPGQSAKRRPAASRTRR